MDETKSLYELMGEEAGIKKLITRFYDLMETAPEAKDVLAVHPKNLKQSREKFYLFLVGWTGGPQTYIETRGHPALKRRHQPFAIGPKERDQWYWCMDKALDESGYDPEVIVYLKNHFKDATEFLRNRTE
ncbi:MAG: group II truncated hemoglobin [Anaerolineales bacterium]|nr:group II truncated hemoglobin [Anaerolineales bacterium]